VALSIFIKLNNLIGRHPARKAIVGAAAAAAADIQIENQGERESSSW
jgi:hypothetical protein